VNSLYKSILVWLLTMLLFQACIRDEVLSPPQILPLAKTIYVSAEVLLISGENFDPGSIKIFIDNVEIPVAGTVTINSAYIIVPTTTTTKEVSLYVATKFGTSSSVRFTIQPPLPSILKVIPAKAGIGQTIKIYGSSLASLTAVSFNSPGGSPVMSAFTKFAEDSIRVTVPTGLAFDAADITLIAGTTGTSSPFPFTVLRPPVVSSFAPTKGIAGTIVTVNGENLTPLLSVSLGTQKLEVISSAATSLSARIATSPVGDTIKIVTWGGNSKTTTKFLIIPPPAITSIDKLTGTEGTEVKLTGTNFSEVFEVRFGTTTTAILSNTDTEIKVKVPPGATTSKITVTTPAGNTTSTNDFVIQAPPIVSDFLPAMGIVGTKVTVTGLNFGAATATPHNISIGLLPLTNVVWTDTRIEGNIPAEAVTGKIIVNAPNGTSESAGNFLITGSPQILNFSPSTGIVGTVVTITGINMGTTPDVRFNTIKATTITRATATEIICQVPVGATSGKISVNNALSATSFTINASPTITSLSPSRGGTDTEVTITGTFLTGATVKFANNITATKVGSDTDTQLKVKVPAGAITGKITATNPGGSVTSVGNFEILPPPTVTSFSPAAGAVGTLVTIFGTNLQYTPVVRFNSTLAIIKSITATQLIVEVPAGALDGKISVKTEGVLTSVISTNNFDVITSPVITSITPASGSTGDKITLLGTDFNNLVSVTFDGVAVTSFVSSTSSRIELIIPSVSNPLTRSVNVNVKTSVSISSNATFSFLGAPVVYYPAPAANPLNWALLIEGQGLTTVKKIVINGATATIDYQATNAITTRVPQSAGIGSGSIKVYYSDLNFISLEFTVLSAPPPGVFPPPFIVIPPPPPGNFVPVAVNADWHNAYEDLHWFRIDANLGSYVPDEFGNPISFNSSGTFTVKEHYDGNDNELKNLLEGNNGSGSWSRSTLTLRIRGDTYRGLYNQGFQMVLTSSNTGHQMVLGSPCPRFPDCK
jgi:IPT/TIG domain